MSPKLSREMTLQLGALLVVSGLLVYASLSSDRQLNKIMPESHTWASSSNLKPSGMSACLELLQKVFGNSRKVRTWELPYRTLSGRKPPTKLEQTLPDAVAAKPTHGVLILVSPDQSLAEYEVAEILSWVEKGNCLIYLDSFMLRTSRRLVDKLGLEIKQLEPAISDKLSDPRFNDRYYDHLRQLTVSADHSLRGGTKIATIDNACVIAEKEYGKGRVLVASCPSLLINRQISLSSRWSNFQFLSNWIATTDGDIIFDERCHGLSQGINVFYYFLRGPFGWALAQIGLILALAVLSTNQRFGATRKIIDRRRISNLEHINGLSNTYMRARAKQAVIEIIWQNLRLKLCKFLQISPHEPNERLMEELKAHGGEQSTGMALVAEKCEQAVLNNALSDEQLLELVQSCDKISEATDRRMTTQISSRGQDATTSSTDR